MPPSSSDWLSALPPRAGEPPRTTATNPHTQLTQVAPTGLQDELRAHALALPGVEAGPSAVSVPGTVAFHLRRPPSVPTVADVFGSEFGHIHPHDDGSLHLVLPAGEAERLVGLGWAEQHPMARRGLVPPLVVMLYGPRDRDELAVARAVVQAAHAAAGGAVAATGT